MKWVEDVTWPEVRGYACGPQTASRHQTNAHHTLLALAGPSGPTCACTMDACMHVRGLGYASSHTSTMFMMHIRDNGIRLFLRSLSANTAPAFLHPPQNQAHSSRERQRRAQRGGGNRPHPKDRQGSIPALRNPLLRVRAGCRKGKEGGRARAIRSSFWT